MHSLCAGGIWSSLSIGGTLLSNFIKLALLTAVNFYAIWLIFIGMDKMAHPQCSRYAFFYTKVDIYHWFRTFLKVQYTLICIVTAEALIAFLVFSLSVAYRKGTRKALFSPLVDGGVTRFRRTWGFILVSLIPTLIMCTEFLIRWNHIEGVGTARSTGQLIPLVVAISGLVSVFYKMLVKREEKKRARENRVRGKTGNRKTERIQREEETKEKRETEKEKEEKDIEEKDIEREGGLS